MRRKDSKSKSPTESARARRIRLRVGRVARCTDCYNAAFRNAVAQAWKMYQNGGPIVRRRCGLLSLLKEGDKMFALAVKSLRGGVLVGEFPCPWPSQSVCRVCSESVGSAHSASCAFSGNVDAGHTTTDDVCTKLIDLRARLARLDEEDDQILRGTQRFKLEKQIYDLERELSNDEWPDVIGDEGGNP